MEFQNDQTRCLAGSSNLQLSRTDCETAMRHLDSGAVRAFSFAAYEETLRKIGDLVGETFENSIHRNYAPSTQPDPGELFLPNVKLINQMDEKLYRTLPVNGAQKYPGLVE